MHKLASQPKSVQTKGIAFPGQVSYKTMTHLLGGLADVSLFPFVGE